MSTELNHYREFVISKLPAKWRNKQAVRLNNAALGLAGEAGEVADLIKKLLYHDHPLTDEMQHKLLLELGDVLFYLTSAADALGFTLDDVINGNVVKLDRRYPAGFDAATSQARYSENDAESQQFVRNALDHFGALSTPPLRELLRTDPKPLREVDERERLSVEGITTEGPTMRELDERERLIQTGPSALGIGGPGDRYEGSSNEDEQEFKYGYAVDGRVRQAWDRPATWTGRREAAISADAQPKATGEDVRDTSSGERSSDS